MADGDENPMLASFGLFASLRSCELTVFICSGLSSLNGGEGDLVGFLCVDGERHGEAYPLL